jgi:hypothetical protein
VRVHVFLRVETLLSLFVIRYSHSFLAYGGDFAIEAQEIVIDRATIINQYEYRVLSESDAGSLKEYR